MNGIHIIIYGGERTVQKRPETLGEIIKTARDKSDLTVEELTARVGISERYLYRIENEAQYKSLMSSKTRPGVIH